MAKLVIPVFAFCMLGLRYPDRGSMCDYAHGVIIDTSICTPGEASRSAFLDVVVQKLSVAHIPADILRTRGDDYTIFYFRYDRPTGYYMLLKITTGSSGNAIRYEMKQNIDASADSPRNNKVKIGWLKKMKFQELYEKHGYMVDNCYVTDGSDAIVLISRDDGMINGIAMVGGPNEEKATAPYALFLKNCSNTFNKLLKRLL